MARRRLLVLLTVLAGAATGGCGGASPARTAAPSAGQVANGPARNGHAIAAKGPAGAAPRPVRVTPSHAVVPILMYHVIATAPPGTAYAGLWVPPEAFRAQVAALAGAGFHAVTLETVLEAWRGRARLPAHPIVLTFDDGYLSQGQAAGPILKARGWPGVLYLVLKNLGVEGGISATRITTMIADGWEIGAHTLTHRDLTTLSDADLRHEVAGSRVAIRRRFGVAVDSFCYPSGRFNAETEAAVRAAGFGSATTELPGAAHRDDDRYALPRIRVNGSDSAATLLAAVRAALGSA